MRILAILLTAALAGCQSGPRIYTDSVRTCSWDTVDELIICKGQEIPDRNNPL